MRSLDDLSNWWEADPAPPKLMRLMLFDRAGDVIYDRVVDTRHGFSYMPGPDLSRIARVHLEPVR